MKINGNAVRPGMVIEHQKRLWVATKIQHTQPGKGGAYLQVELKDLLSGSKLNERFRASENIERKFRNTFVIFRPIQLKCTFLRAGLPTFNETRQSPHSKEAH